MSADPIEVAFRLDTVAALRNAAGRYARCASEGACASDKSRGVLIFTAEAASAKRQAARLAALASEFEAESKAT